MFTSFSLRLVQRISMARGWCYLILIVGMLLPSSSAYGQSRVGTGSGVSSYFANWFNRVAKIQAKQPDWITPLATISPHFGEEFRYDIDWQTNITGIGSENYGGGKGLKLDPFEHIEVLINLPPYLVHNNP